ncbi:MAG: hypothetical protein KGZ34_00350 [Nitrosarchaeum sp.]|nr:hypothetical protein [Nitrosarchaeum sp.]
MQYGTIRNQARDEINTVLKNTDSIRYGELERIIVIDKKVCSERIFREILDELVQNKIVIKHVIARNNTIYTINSKITTMSDEQVEEFIETMENIKIGTTGILKTISSDADDSTKVEEVMKFLHWISIYEMQSMMVSRVSGKRKLTTMTKQITKYKKQVLDSLSDKGSSSFDLLGGLVFARLFAESFRLDPKMLEMFVDDFIKPIKKYKQKH